MILAGNSWQSQNPIMRGIQQEYLQSFSYSVGKSQYSKTLPLPRGFFGSRIKAQLN
jgi:hypothetical protein